MQMCCEENEVNKRRNVPREDDAYGPFLCAIAERLLRRSGTKAGMSGDHHREFLNKAIGGERGMRVWTQHIWGRMRVSCVRGGEAST